MTKVRQKSAISVKLYSGRIEFSSPSCREVLRIRCSLLCSASVNSPESKSESELRRRAEERRGAICPVLS